MFSRAIVAACCLSLLPISAAAEAPVWQIHKQGKTIYLAGTIHLLSASDYPLPDAFEQAYAGSETVYLETDGAQLKSAEFQQRMLQRLSYPEGESLVQHISEETLLALKRYFGERGIAVEPMLGLRVGMLTILMTVNELSRLGINSAGVDEYFERRAREDGKRLGQLETAEAQLGFLANLGVGREDDMLQYQIEEMQRLPGLWRQLMKNWRKGDLEELERIAMADMRDLFPGMYDLLIKQRNADWLPKIEAMFDTTAVEMVLVGSLHLVGEDGLLAGLAARGYQVTQLQ